MNRSILIVICDFLLVSLLVFSTPDIDKVRDKGIAQSVKLDITQSQADSTRQDLGNVMKQALDEERKSRDAVLAELAQTRDTAAKQQAQLTDREKQVQTFEQELQSKQEDAQRLQEQQAALQQQLANAQTNLQTLNQQLKSTSVESTLTKEQLAATQAEIKKQADDAAALQQKLAQLAKSNEQAQAEKQQLANRLQVAEAEKRSATEMAARMQDEVKVEREEKAKLADGVKALASKSGELAEEVRENRPIAPNTIFNDFLTNRVEAAFNASKSGIFGIDASKRRDTETVLVADGANIFAVCHVQDTPLALWNPGVDWEGLTGTLTRDTNVLPIAALSFTMVDPRVVIMPVTKAQAKQLGSRVYHTSADPFRFQDAVLVGTREGYYGECNFQIDTSTPDYVKMDHNSLKGLFGKFNPSKGDMVFSRQGDLLGVMVNNTYCMVLHNFEPIVTFQFGQDVRAQHTGENLSALHTLLAGMPPKLQ